MERDWYVNDIDEPYVDDSDPKFVWVRPRVVGGRMNIWGRGCLRISDFDFKAASHDGARRGLASQPTRTSSRTTTSSRSTSASRA